MHRGRPARADGAVVIESRYSQFHSTLRGRDDFCDVIL